MKTNLTEGLIMLKDDLGIEYKIAKISYLVKEDESFVYTFEPYYNVIELIEAPFFQGIPGLDLSLRKAQYIRENQIPVFISERTPSANRVDLFELLDTVGMNYLNQLEWLIRTDLKYAGDNFYVIRYDDSYNISVNFDNAVSPLSAATGCKRLLSVLAHGKDVEYGDTKITDKNRKEIFKVLHAIYANDCMKNKVNRTIANKNCKNKNNRGRRKAIVDELVFNEIYQSYKKGKITGEKAAESLGISRATFMRRIKNNVSS